MKKIYFMIVFIISLMALAVYTTYAMFTADLNIGQAFDLTASSIPTDQNSIEYKTIGLDAYQSRNIDLNITNSTDSSLYYGVWYEMVDPTTINSNIKIGIASTSANPAIGQLASSATKTVSVYIKNNTSSAIVINLGAGYSSTNSLNLPTERTLISQTIDNEEPSLSLDKVTYVDLPFDNSWTYDDATVTDGVLSYDLATYKVYAASPYIPVNGEFWYMSFDAFSEGNGRVYWDAAYLDDNYAPANALNGYSSNGSAFTISQNEWVNNKYWNTDLAYWKSTNRYGPAVKYIKISFRTTSTYNAAPLKLRNLKVYGQMKNSFYLINVVSSDNVAVITTKCAKGSHSKEYFKEHGTVVNNGQIMVTSNGAYTVYVEDAMGNSTIDTIEITNINVPNDYQKVEYIASSGTQYIDTGYYWQNENIKSYLDATVTSNSSSQSLFGNEEYTASSGTTRNFAGIPFGSNGTYSIYLGSGSQGSISTTVGTRFALDLQTTAEKNLKVYLNGESKIDKTYGGSVLTKQTAYTNSSVSTTVGNIFLFANHNSGRGSNNNPTQNIGGMRVYDFKLYDNGINVRNMVPVYRKSDEVRGMYDTVNGVFYTDAANSATPFSKGSNISDISETNIPDNYQRVEYIESSGSQYIDTGTKFNSNSDKFELNYKANDATGNYFIAGSGNSENGKIWVYSYKNGGRFSVYITDTGGTQRQLYGFSGPDALQHLVVYDAKKLYIDGNLTADGSSYTFGETPYNYTLFNSIGTTSYYAKTRIYSFKMWRSNTLTRDMVPCYRKSDGIIGMYDTVNGVFYINSGTGTFSKGPNV